MIKIVCDLKKPLRNPYLIFRIEARYVPAIKRGVGRFWCVQCRSGNLFLLF